MIDHIGIGMLGYGMIGRVHCLGYRDLPLLYPRQLPSLRLAAVCTSRPDTAAAAADEAGFAAATGDLAALLANEDVDVVDCVTPNHLHRPMVLAALAAGKHVYCEKPLALSGAEAREIAAAAAASGLSVGMTFNYRFVPAVMRAKQMLAAGALGEVYSFRACYLHGGYQNPDRPLSWRLRREQAGGGALYDLGAHVVDLIRHLLGEFAAVRATLRTYVTERPIARGAAQRAPVDVDDAAWMEVRMAGSATGAGASGTIEVSRFATGTVDDLRFEIYGERGALRFDLMDPNWLYWFDAARPDQPLGGERGWTRIETTARYPAASVPPARTVLGWARTHAENQYAFLHSLVDGTAPHPGVFDGLRTQLILDAALSSAHSGAWTTVALA